MSVLSLEISVLSFNYYQFQIVEIHENASLDSKTSGAHFTQRLLLNVLSRLEHSEFLIFSNGKTEPTSEPLFCFTTYVTSRNIGNVDLVFLEG